VIQYPPSQEEGEGGEKKKKVYGGIRGEKGNGVEKLSLFSAERHRAFIEKKKESPPWLRRGRGGGRNRRRIRGEKESESTRLLSLKAKAAHPNTLCSRKRRERREKNLLLLTRSRKYSLSVQWLRDATLVQEKKKKKKNTDHRDHVF